jgi:tetratricopeptide (TPR) repeat protein
MRWCVAAVIAGMVVAFGAIQMASDAFASSAAAAGTLPTRIPPRFGAAVYEVLDRIAPAPYVEATLAQSALARGDSIAAQRYAVRLPASPMRDEFLGKIAAASGEQMLALEYFLAAPDAVAVARAAEARAARNPAAGYDLERLLRNRLALLTTHPDAVAETDWRMGRLANRTAWIQVPGSPLQRAWLYRGLRAFEAAVALSPLSERYVIADANQADLLGEHHRAAQLFAQAVEIDPGSADATAGLGVVALQSGDRAAALRYLVRARRLDAHALMVRALERQLQ